MNKLITTNAGGFPFQLDDLRFIDESVREVLKANFDRYIDKNDPNDKGFLIENSLLRRNTALNIPVGGNSGQAMPEMFVYISGEIYYLPAQNLPTGLDNVSGLFVEPEISFTNTTPGQKVFENGATVQTYEIRRARYTKTPTQPNYIRINNSGTIDPANVTAGFDFEFETNCSLIQREYESLSINSLESADNIIFQLITNLNASVTTIQNNLNPILNDDWIDVPHNVLTRTTNPVIFISSTENPGSTTYTGLIASGGSISTTDYLFKLKRIGKTIICSFNLNSIVLPNYPNGVKGLFIDLNNLGVSGFLGGFMKDFRADVNFFSSIDSPASDRLEVISFNNAGGVSGRNGLFLRMREGTGRNYAYLNVNYYYPPAGGIYSGSTRTKVAINNDVYPSGTNNYDICGEIIFEMY